MKQRKLGHSGLSVSVVGLGCNNFGGRIGLEASRSVVNKAIDLGVTMFDTADVYGDHGRSETILGEALGKRRHGIVLATKFGMNMDTTGRLGGASRGYIISAVEASLKRLNTDWIDLYQLHTADPETPMDETLRALDDLIHQGKIRYAGCSNLPAWQVADAHWISKSLGINGFVSCQDEFSLLSRDVEHELVPAIQAYGMGLLPYFPLASGMLTGKYERRKMPKGSRLATAPRLAEKYMTEKNWTIVESLRPFAFAKGHSLLEVAIGWLVAKPFVSSVIAGATTAEQVEQNVAAAEWELSPAELDDIGKILSVE
jgi:aryl-alcohol dehydrogenase-like predicted oxidoreductase